jgi:hypothetical protein
MLRKVIYNDYLTSIIVTQAQLDKSVVTYDISYETFV